MSLETAQNRIKQEANKVNLENDNKLLKAALVEAQEENKRITADYGKRMSNFAHQTVDILKIIDGKLGQTNNLSKESLKQYDILRKEVAEHVRNSLKTNFEDVFDEIGTVSKNYLKTTIQGVQEVKEQVHYVKKSIVGLAYLFFAVLAIVACFSVYTNYNINKSLAHIDNSIGNMSDVMTKDAKYYYDSKDKTLYIKHIEQQKKAE